MKNKHYVFTRKLSDETAIGDYLVYSCTSHGDYCWYEGSVERLRFGIIAHHFEFNDRDYKTVSKYTWEEIESILLDNEITYEIVNV